MWAWYVIICTVSYHIIISRRSNLIYLLLLDSIRQALSTSDLRRRTLLLPPTRPEPRRTHRIACHLCTAMTASRNIDTDAEWPQHHCRSSDNRFWHIGVGTSKLMLSCHQIIAILHHMSPCCRYAIWWRGRRWRYFKCGVNINQEMAAVASDEEAEGKSVPLIPTILLLLYPHVKWLPLTCLVAPSLLISGKAKVSYILTNLIYHVLSLTSLSSIVPLLNV